jgi:hypothetical protein
LLWPVNPKTDAKKCERITIDAILWLDDDESRAGLLRYVIDHPLPIEVFVAAPSHRS